MNTRGMVRGMITVGLVLAAAMASAFVAAASSFDRGSGSSTTSGKGVTASWSAKASDGTVKSLVSVSRNWYDVNVASVGKSQAGVCKNFTPTFSGTAHIQSVLILNGELRADSQGFWKVPGGTASADLWQLLQVGSTMNKSGIMFVASTIGLPHAWTANAKQVGMNVTSSVTKGRVVEICAGIMTNASVMLGGGTAISDFSSSRFARSYVKDITLSK